MPPKRRKSALATQQTLTFGPRNKVTKPTLPASTKSKPSPLSQPGSKAPSTASPALTSEDETDSEPPLRKHSEDEVEKEPILPKSPGGRLAIREVKTAAPARSEVEERAARVSEAEVKRYWRAKEEERKTKRVHQEGLSTNEKILRYFDISSQFGPCIGIARMKRWKRADALGLKPPIEVLAVLLKEQARQSKDADHAYLDDLLSGQTGVD